MDYISPLTIQPHPYIGDSTGRPLEKGLIFIGEANKDPEFHQIPVFTDSAMTKPVPQPLRTKAGYISVNGDVSEIYASAEIYSIKIIDSSNRKVIYNKDLMRGNLTYDALRDINIAIAAAEQRAITAIAGVVSDAEAAIGSATDGANQLIADGSADIASLALAANGDENTQVVTRTGETYPSAKKAIKTMFANGGLPAIPFATKALMTASALVDGDYAQVTDDAVADNNGLYIKTTGAWVKSGYDPVETTLLKVQNVFATKSLMTASTLPDGSNAFVNNDTVLVNNGFYKKTAGAWNLLKYNSDQTIRHVGNVTSITELIKPFYLTNNGSVASGQASWSYFKVNITSRQDIFVRYPAHSKNIGLSRFHIDTVVDGVTQRVIVYGELVDSDNYIYKVIIPTEYVNTATHLYVNNLNLNNSWGADANSVPIEIYLDEVTSDMTTLGIDSLKSYPLVDGGARNLLKNALTGTIEKEFGGNIFNSTMTEKGRYVNKGGVVYSGQSHWSIGLVPYDKNSRYFIENPDIASSLTAKDVGLTNASVTEVNHGTAVEFVEFKRVSPFSDIYEIIIPSELEDFVAKSIVFNMFSDGAWEEDLTSTNIKVYKDYVGGSFQGDLIAQYDGTGFIDTGARKELGFIQDKLMPISRAYKDKTIMTFGDSLTMGTEGGYQRYLQHLLGAKIINHGRNGAIANRVAWIALGNDIAGNQLPASEITDKDYSKVDVVTIMIGTNDFGQSAAYWDSLASIPETSVYTRAPETTVKDYFAPYFTTDKFAAILAGTIEYIKYKNPNIQVFLISPPHQTRDELLNVSKHKHVYKGIAEKCGAIYLDATDSAGLSRKEISQWSYDTIHLNAFGNKVLGTWLAQKIASAG